MYGCPALTSHTSPTAFSHLQKPPFISQPHPARIYCHIPSRRALVSQILDALAANHEVLHQPEAQAVLGLALQSVADMCASSAKVTPPPPEGAAGALPAYTTGTQRGS